MTNIRTMEIAKKQIVAKYVHFLAKRARQSPDDAIVNVKTAWVMLIRLYQTSRVAWYDALGGLESSQRYVHMEIKNMMSETTRIQATFLSDASKMLPQLLTVSICIKNFLPCPLAVFFDNKNYAFN